MSVFKGAEWEQVSEGESRYGISDAKQAVFRGKERPLSLGNRMSGRRESWPPPGPFLGTRPGTNPHVELIGELSCRVATWKNSPFLLYYHYLPHPRHFWYQMCGLSTPNNSDTNCPELELTQQVKDSGLSSTRLFSYHTHTSDTRCK